MVPSFLAPILTVLFEPEVGPVARMRVGQAAAVAIEGGAADQLVIGRPDLEQDHVTALFAAEVVPTRPHRLEDVAVTDRGLHDDDAGCLHPELEPKVRHDGRDDSALGQPPCLVHGHREDREQLITVDDRTIGRDRETPVSVAVVGDTDIGSALDHGGDQLFQMG